MNQYKQHLRKLELASLREQEKDGFSSCSLRREILEKLSCMFLPESAEEINFYRNDLGKEEKIRIKFLNSATRAGGEIARRSMAGCLLIPQEDYNYRLIMDGAEIIGSEIAWAYAIQLYPDKRRLRDHGLEKAPDIPQEPGDNSHEHNYAFTVHRYRQYFELGNLEKTDSPPGCDMFYDGVSERYTESFVFSTPEEADSYWNQWDRYIEGKTSIPPFNYSFEVTTNSQGIRTVGSIVHAERTKTDSTRIRPDGTRIELFVFSSFGQAERQRILAYRKSEPKSKPIPKQPPPQPEISQQK